MNYVYMGAKLECAHSEITSRKILPGSLVSFQDFGMFSKFKCERNSKAKNIKELNPKFPIVNKFSHLNLNDALSGSDLVIYAEGIIALKIDKINLTGRHKAQKTNLSCFIFAEITRMTSGISGIKDKLQVAPLSQKLLNEWITEQNK